MLWKKSLWIALSILITWGINSTLQAQDGTVALSLLKKQAVAAGYQDGDLDDIRLQDAHRSTQSALTHHYFQQHFADFPVRSGLASVHIDDAGELVHINLNLEREIQERVESQSVQISPEQALLFAKQQMAIPTLELSAQQLVFETNAKQRLRLAYELTVDDRDKQKTYVVWIDAANGQLLSHLLRTVSCDFGPRAVGKKSPIAEAHCQTEANIRAQPLIDSPSSFAGIYNILAPPLESALVDQRSPQSGASLIDPLASPHGWHDTDGDASSIEFGYTRGNNVYAYYAPADMTNPQAIPILRAGPNGPYIGGNVPWPAANSLSFLYNHNLYQPNSTGLVFLEDAITNLFVWNNIAHDIFYRYGFDEAAGNFQTTNHTNMGLGGDAVLAHAQVGPGINQASFSTAPEGQASSIMRMYLWETDIPNSIRDGAFDNLVMVHEYGHGVAFRLVGGPSNVNCLFNFEQGGEGYSDFFGLLFTSGDRNGNGILEENVLGEGIRGIGHYLINEPETESGIRPRHYTTNMDDCSADLCNEYTYADLPNMGFPHGVGFLWASMLWDMHWALVRSYGFEPNLQNVNSGAGNVRALRIVVESLKMLPCQPTFIDMKEQIILANQAIYGGAGESIIQAAFARRGLGAGATAGGGASFVDPNLQLTKTVDQMEIINGESVTYTLTLTNRYPFPVTNALITDQLPDYLTVTDGSAGWTVQNGLLRFPAVPLLAPNATVSRYFTATVNAPEGTSVLFEQAVENNNINGFTVAGTWLLSTDGENPNTDSEQAWFQLATGFPLESSLLLDLNLVDGANNHLAFWQSYDMENTIDGGVIEFEQSPNNWVDLGDRIIQNGYDAVIRDELISPIGLPIPFTSLSRKRAFTGYSGGYRQTIIDLNGLSFSNSIRIRFRYVSNNGNNTNNCNASPAGCDGWFLDDFRLLDLRHVLNTACATAEPSLQACGGVGQVGTIYFGEPMFPVEWLSFRATAAQQQIQLHWETRSEIDNTGFHLQRRAETESSFHNIAWIASAASTGMRSYDYTDRAVEAGVQYYYRLEQVDIDGSTSFSPIRQAMLPHTTNQWHVYPNPVRDMVRIVYGEPLTHKMSMRIYDALGRMVSEEVLLSGSEQSEVDLRHLASGIYYIRVGNQSERIVLQ